MIIRFLQWVPAISLALVTLASCSGGGMDGSGAGGGMSSTGMSTGAITGFGSIFVNGVEFDTSGATITLDGQPSCDPKRGCANPLKKGMVVQVQGSFGATSGTAMHVDAEDAVKGPVESVAADGLSLIVLGQTVLVDNTTVIDDSIGSSITALKPGDFVEVHGFVKTVVQAGVNVDVIVATFIEKKDSLAEFDVTGFARSIDTMARTFTLGALIVDYHSADTTDLAGGNPVEGQLVEAKGPNNGAQTSGTPLIATKVEPQQLALDDAEEAEIEGFVTSLTSMSNFVVNGQQVMTSSSTVFSGGSQSDVAVGVKLEVEGTFAGGVLMASKVSFRDSVRLDSTVTTLSGTAPNLSLMR